VSFNWVDMASIGIVSVVAAVQFLRGVKDFSRVFYETLLLIAAVVGATQLTRPLHDGLKLPVHLVFGGAGVVLGAAGILLAALVNRKFAFGLGVFNYVMALFLAVACGYALGHLAFRTAYLALAEKDPKFVEAVRRSWMARDLLYFKTFVETRAILRQARWLNL
jgi:hypothetical protein